MKKLTEIPCPLCGSKSYSIMYRSTLTEDDFTLRVLKENLKNSLDDYTKHGQIVRCLECRLVYTNPRENIATLLKGYEQVEDPEYIKTEKFRKILLSEHLKKLEYFTSAGRILDVGCFAGYFLSSAKNHGWETFGIEPSLWARTIAKKTGASILGKNIEKTNLPKNFFDAVTLWDVIEHLEDPKKIIAKIYQTLKPGGVIALGTPHIDSLFARILGEKCPFFIRMHLVLFSPKTLGRMLEENGFLIVSTSYYGRIFPVSYILDRVQIKNDFYKTFKKTVKSLPFLPHIPVRLDFHDSFLMIAKKPY